MQPKSTEELEYARSCVIYKASYEIRKILDAARKACVLDLVFESRPMVKEILDDVGGDYGLLVLDENIVNDDVLYERLMSVTRNA